MIITSTPYLQPGFHAVKIIGIISLPNHIRIVFENEYGHLSKFYNKEQAFWEFAGESDCKKLFSYPFYIEVIKSSQAPKGVNGFAIAKSKCTSLKFIMSLL